MGSVVESRVVSAGHIATLVTVMMLSVALAETACAAEYPVKNVTIIVPFSPGGSSDVQARLVAKGLADRLGKPVVIDNRPGAGGRIGSGLVARAKPDGHTLLLGNISTLVTGPVLRTNVGYDPQRDFAPITIISETPFLLAVSSSSRASNIADLLAQARADRGMSYGSWGPGSSGHLLGEMFKASAQVDILHVAYKGEAPAMFDLMGGQISMMFATAPAAMAYIRAGKLRALAVTGSDRLAVLPKVPTLTESGVPGVNFKTWYGILAPANTPPDVVARLHKEITGVLKSRDLTDWAEGQGVVVVASSPQELARRIQLESTSIAKLLNTINVKVDE